MEYKDKEILFREFMSRWGGYLFVGNNSNHHSQLPLMLLINVCIEADCVGQVLQFRIFYTLAKNK